MPIPGDPYWESVSLLLHADETIGTGTTVDVSPTPKTVVAQGSATISNNRAKFGAGSISWSAAGNYFQVDGGMGGELGSVDFTIEGWVFLTGGTATGAFLDITNPASTYGGIHFTPSGIYASTGGTWDIVPQAGLSLVDSKWHHFALTRSGSDLSLWIDGVRKAQYNVGSATFSVGSGGLSGRVYLGSAANASAGSLDEIRITRGVARYSATFTPPDAPFPGDESYVKNSLYRLEAVAESNMRLPGDVRSHSAAKQVLLQVTPQVRDYYIEAVAKDASFVMLPDLFARSAAKTVLLAVVPRLYGYRLEAVASADAVLPGDVRTRSVAKQALFSATAQTSKYKLEAVAAHSGFVLPGDLRARSAAKQVVVAQPRSIHDSGYRLEAVGYGNLPTPSSLFTVEAVSGLPYSSPISNFTLEAVAESTITPPRPQTTVVWFTVIDP